MSRSQPHAERRRTRGRGDRGLPGLAEQGHAPEIEEFAARYPDLKDDVRAALEGLELVHGLLGSASCYRGSGHGSRPRARHRVGPADRRLSRGPRAGTRRHGDGLRGRARGTGPSGGAQGAGHPRRARLIGPAAVPERSPHRGRAAPYAHRAGLRRRPGRRPVLLRHAADRRERTGSGRASSPPEPARLGGAESADPGNDRRDSRRNTASSRLRTAPGSASSGFASPRGLLWRTALANIQRCGGDSRPSTAAGAAVLELPARSRPGRVDATRRHGGIRQPGRIRHFDRRLDGVVDGDWPHRIEPNCGDDGAAGQAKRLSSALVRSGPHRS